MQISIQTEFLTFQTNQIADMNCSCCGTEQIMHTRYYSMSVKRRTSNYAQIKRTELRWLLLN